MRELEALGGSIENYGVLADYIAFANGFNRYFKFLRPLQHLSQSFGCSTRCVFFHLVMRFDYFRAEIRTEQFGSHAGQPEEHVHSNAEVRREHNRYGPRGFFDDVTLFLRMPCRPNNKRPCVA